MFLDVNQYAGAFILPQKAASFLQVDTRDDMPPGNLKDPALPVLDLARKAAGRGLSATLAWTIARTALKLCFAMSLALAAGPMVETGAVSLSAAIGAMAFVLLAAAAGFVGDRVQASAEAGVALAVQATIHARLGAFPARSAQAKPSGALIAALQRYPERIAALVVGHRASLAMLGIGPLMAVSAMLFVSWQAALTLLVASPVMIVFFVLVGGAIHSRSTAQEKAFGRLAAQFEDRVRTLPTILSAHGLARERQKLAERMTDYARSTMAVLQVAFLNAGIIDFFSSVSIAVLAVFLGLGHLGLAEIPGFSALQLWQSLFILMLAPEFFAPFRRYAEQYHAKAEGQAAGAGLEALLEADADSSASGPVAAAGAWQALDPALPARGMVAVIGPSGAGKSTLLRRLAGVEGTGIVPAPPQAVDWISTDIHLGAGTLANALSWNRQQASPTRLLMAASRLGLLDDELLPGGLDARIEAGGTNLSGGQRLRIGVARALLSDRPVFADEPTAKLDADNAERVRRALVELASERLVIVATHDPLLAAKASSTIDLQPKADAADRVT